MRPIKKDRSSKVIKFSLNPFKDRLDFRVAFEKKLPITKQLSDKVVHVKGNITLTDTPVKGSKHLYEFYCPQNITIRGILRRHTPVPEHNYFFLKQDINGKYYAIIPTVSVIEPQIPINTDKAIGIDVGIVSFATLSDGTSIENHHSYAKMEDKISGLSKRISETTDAAKLKRLQRALNYVQAKIRDTRNNAIHQASRDIVNQYDVICVEAIDLKRMIQDKDKQTTKDMSDVAWGKFFNFLKYKSREAGKTFVEVNPSGTSRVCSICGHYHKENNVQYRTFVCELCGHHENKDVNAAKNILKRGIDKIQRRVR